MLSDKVGRLIIFLSPPSKLYWFQKGGVLKQTGVSLGVNTSKIFLVYVIFYTDLLVPQTAL